MTETNPNATVTFGAIDSMANENKGAFGETLAGLWLKDHLKANPSLLTDEPVEDPDPRMWFSHVGERHRCKYGKVGRGGVEEIAWEPDFSFHLTLPEHDVRTEVLIEAKTGGSSLVRDQYEVMELVAQEEGTAVFVCNVTLTDDHAEVDYERVQPTT